MTRMLKKTVAIVVVVALVILTAEAKKTSLRDGQQVLSTPSGSNPMTLLPAFTVPGMGTGPDAFNGCTEFAKAVMISRFLSLSLSLSDKQDEMNQTPPTTTTATAVIPNELLEAFNKFTSFDTCPVPIPGGQENVQLDLSADTAPEVQQMIEKTALATADKAASCFFSSLGLTSLNNAVMKVFQVANSIELSKCLSLFSRSLHRTHLLARPFKQVVLLASSHYKNLRLHQ